MVKQFPLALVCVCALCVLYAVCCTLYIHPPTNTQTQTSTTTEQHNQRTIYNQNVPIKDSVGDGITAVIDPRGILEKRRRSTVLAQVLFRHGTRKDSLAVFVKVFAQRSEGTEPDCSSSSSSGRFGPRAALQRRQRQRQRRRRATKTTNGSRCKQHGMCASVQWMNDQQLPKDPNKDMAVLQSRRYTSITLKYRYKKESLSPPDT
jgi:hypothetical protein